MQSSIVAFLDILGFRSFVTSTAAAGRSMDPLIEALVAVKAARSQTLFGDSVGGFTAFSDSIVISNPLPQPVSVEPGEYRPRVAAAIDVIETSAEAGIALLENGLLCRGGIALGELHHGDDVLVGPGLIAAYDLESAVAVYPRIVVAEEVISLLRTMTHVRLGKDLLLPSQEPWITLKQDRDGVWFADLFQRMAIHRTREFRLRFGEVHALVRRRLEPSDGVPDAKTRAKYRWLASQVNDVLERSAYFGVWDLPLIDTT